MLVEIAPAGLFYWVTLVFLFAMVVSIIATIFLAGSK